MYERKKIYIAHLKAYQCLLNLPRLAGDMDSKCTVSVRYGEILRSFYLC